MKQKVSTLKNLQIMHVALCAGVLFLTIVMGDFSSDKWTLEMGDAYHLIMIGLVPVLSIVIGALIFRNRISGIEEIEDFDAKMQLFHSAHIIRLALLEGAALFIVILTRFSGDILSLSMFTLVFVRMILLFPTKDKVYSNIHWPER